MLKVALLALIALIAVVVAQQADANVVTSTNTTELAGVPAELAALVDAGMMELTKKISIQPTQAQLDAIRAAALASPEFAGLQALSSLNADQVAAYRDTLQANITAARAAYDAYKAQVVANLTDALARWKIIVANLTANRDLAVDDLQTLLQRAKAVLIYQVAKVAARQIAAEVVALKATGQRIELGFRFLNATVFFLNNTIALLNNSNVGGMTWTPFTNVTLLEEKLLALYIANKVGDWALGQIKLYVVMITAENVAALQDIIDRAKAFVNKVYETVDNLRTRWAATASLNQTLGDHIEAFLENVTGVQVTITGLDGAAGTPITVTVTFTRADLATETRAIVEAWLIKHIKALLIAYAGQQDSGVVTVANPVAKRQASSNSYSLTSTMQPASQPPTDSGAASLAVSALAAGAAVALVLRN